MSETAPVNIVDDIGYWREYPERDLEHVRRYPCTLEKISEKIVWKKKKMAFSCYIPNMDGNMVNDYVEAIKNELNMYAAKPYIEDREVIAGALQGEIVSLSCPQIKEVFESITDRLEIRNGVYFSAELTRFAPDPERANLLWELGVRQIDITIKAQEVMSSQDAWAALEGGIEGLKQAGFDHLKIKLHYGQAGESLEQWQGILDKIVVLPIESIELVLLDANFDQQQMYADGIEKLLNNGYVAVTNTEFAKETMNPEAIFYELGESGHKGMSIVASLKRLYLWHNWHKGGEVVGIGAGASGKIKRYIYRNHPDPKEYIETVNNGKLPIIEGSYVTAQERVCTSLLYGLKMLKLSREDFKNLHGTDMISIFKQQIDELQAQGLVRLTDKALEVTYPKGLVHMEDIAATIMNYKI